MFVYKSPNHILSYVSIVYISIAILYVWLKHMKNASSLNTITTYLYLHQNSLLYQQNVLLLIIKVLPVINIWMAWICASDGKMIRMCYFRQNFMKDNKSNCPSKLYIYTLRMDLSWNNFAYIYYSKYRIVCCKWIFLCVL